MELSKGMMYTVCTVNTHKDQSYYSMEEKRGLATPTTAVCHYIHDVATTPRDDHLRPRVRSHFDSRHPSRKCFDCSLAFATALRLIQK